MLPATGAGASSFTPGTVDLTTEEGPTFLQERLSFFAAVGFLFQTGFFVHAAEAFLIVSTCTLAVLPLTKPGTGAGTGFGGLLIVVTVLLARAVIVPSSPRRESSPLSTIAVSLPERLAGAGPAR